MQIAVAVLCAVLCLMFLIQAAFYVLPAIGLKKKSAPNNISAEMPGVSVVIACHNELENIKENLQYIVNQEYDVFEVVIIDDNSDDGTSEYADSLPAKFPNVRVFHNKSRGKKSALTLGIENATYDHLLFIDADCRPSSEMWISGIMSYFDEENPLVIGYGELSGKSFAARFSAYDADLIAMQYSGFAKLGHPYMAVGRNLAYSRKLWEVVGGFCNHSDLRSGDDDLFVKEAVRHSKVNVSLSPKTKTISPAKESFAALLRQKSRHVTTSARYTMLDKFLSGGEIVSRTLFFVLAITFAFFSWCWAVSIIVARMILVFCSLAMFKKETKCQLKLPMLLVFDIFAPIFYIVLLFYKLFNRQPEW